MFPLAQEQVHYLSRNFHPRIPEFERILRDLTAFSELSPGPDVLPAWPLLRHFLRLLNDAVMSRPLRRLDPEELVPDRVGPAQTLSALAAGLGILSTPPVISPTPDAEPGTTTISATVYHS